jgi:hypothetical protein
VSGGGLRLGSYEYEQGVGAILQDWQRLMCRWYSAWQDIAIVFSSLAVDRQGRYAPRERESIATDLEFHLAQGLLDLSDPSLWVLRRLARCIRSSSHTNDPSEWFYKGPSGLIALDMDAANYQGRRLAVYPRVRVATDKAACQMLDFRTIKIRTMPPKPEFMAKAGTILRSVIKKGIDNRGQRQTCKQSLFEL